MFDRTILLALGLLLLLLVGLHFGFGIRLPGWAPVLIYVVLYAGVAAFLPRAEPESDSVANRPGRDSVPAEEWPMSGPMGRFGQRGLVLSFQLTSMLALLNPLQFVQIVRQGLGNAKIRRRISEAPPFADTWVNRVRYTLPLGPIESRAEETRSLGAVSWFVYNGGITRDESHSWDVLTQRFAYDFVVVDAELRRHRGRGTRPDDYFCHGLDIVAAADGVVVDVERRVGTAPFLGYGIVDFMARSFVGNHVVVRHADDEYSLYAHLVPDSVPVAVGESVRRGQRLGRCGHTGHSSEPHLHFHLQDRADFFTAAGLPVRFHDLVVDGEVVEETWIRFGQRVAAGSDGQQESGNDA